MRFTSKGRKALSKLMIAAALAAVVSIYPVNAEAAVSIRDIDTGADYAKASIIKLAENNIISGDNNGYFHPLDTVKRSEMIKIIVEALGIDTSNLPDEPTFTDVPKSNWAYKYVEAGYREGVIKGVTSSVFGADRECTREEMASMYVRALGLKEEDMKGQQPYLYINRMTDKSSISSWSKENVEFALSSGIMKGTGSSTFGAKLPAERQQVAVLTDRFITGKDAVNKFAGTFKGEVDHPELYNALSENNSKFKGNLDMNLKIGANDGSGNLLSNIAMSVNGLVDADTGKGVMNFDMNYDIGMNITDIPLANQQFRVIKLGDNYYVKYPGSDTWSIKTQKEMEQLGAPSVTGSGDSKQLIRYYRYASINKEPNTDFRGINTTKYTMALGTEAMGALMYGMTEEQAAGIEAQASSGIQNMTGNIEVYLNENNQVIYEKFDATGSVWDESTKANIKVNILMDVYYSNIGQNVDIKAPEITK